MPRGSALSGLEKLLTSIRSEVKGLQKQIKKLAKKLGKPGRKPGRKPGPKPGGVVRRGRKPGPKPGGVVRRGRKPGPKPGGVVRRGRKPGRPKAVLAGGKVGRKRPGRKPRKCSVRGCKNKIYAKGLCANHYQKSRREARKQAGK